jgi:uncharacterized iron-regulated membrane protein
MQVNATQDSELIAGTSPVGDSTRPSAWQRWQQRLLVHKVFLQIHLWLGVLVGIYVVVMSVTGSIIVFRNGVEQSPRLAHTFTSAMEWFVNLHDELLMGLTGRHLNGLGATCLTLICVSGIVVWWPGITHWRRSLGVNPRLSFARLNWDLHNALGLWSLFFVLMCGISGAYFAYPNVFNLILALPGLGVSVGDTALLWLSNLHFGRFNLLSEVIWSVLGPVPAVLSLTGVLVCCHRLLRKHEPVNES